MKTYLPLKTANQEDDFTVGVKASILSHLGKEFTIPFSLVITSDAFFEFISYNTLGEQTRNLIETPLPKLEQVRAFNKLSSDFEKASFPSSVLNSLRECYELLCLDANNLEDLSRNSPVNKKILSFRRSTNYDDGDNICSGTIISKDNFELFLKSIKSVYLSAFAPSSIEFREKNNIKEFSLAIIVTRLPEISTCLEVNLDEDKNSIIVNSYIGFIDMTGVIPKDEFKLEMDFLKITERNMKKQRIAVVFDMEANRPSTKQYMTMNSSNSIEEPNVMEISRLSKKIQQALQHEKVEISFVMDKHKNIFLLDSKTIAPPDEEQKTLVNETSTETKKEENKEDIMNLTHSLRTIFKSHEYGEFSAEIEAALLELRDPKKESILKALKLCIQILQ